MGQRSATNAGLRRHPVGRKVGNGLTLPVDDGDQFEALGRRHLAAGDRLDDAPIGVEDRDKCSCSSAAL
jgi:hypothetical protein